MTELNRKCKVSCPTFVRIRRVSLRYAKDSQAPLGLCLDRILIAIRLEPLGDSVPKGYTGSQKWICAGMDGFNISFYIRLEFHRSVSND